MAKQYKSEGVPIGAVGIQGHIRGLDVNTIKVSSVLHLVVSINVEADFYFSVISCFII